MSDGLRTLLNLPEPPKRDDAESDAVDRFRDAFTGLIKQANEGLQSMAVTAPDKDRAQVATQRDSLYAAYQNVLKRLTDGAAEGAATEVDRVVAAAQTVGESAQSRAADSQAKQQQWTDREADFDGLRDKVGQLDAAGHPRAAALARLVEIIQEKAGERDYAAATDALDRGAEKVDELYDEARAERAAGKRTVAGGGGYVYEQHADGRIFILKSPRTKGDVRIELKRGGKGYNAVLAEIGPFPADDDLPLPVSEPSGEGDASPILDALVAAGEKIAETASELAEEAGEFLAETRDQLAQLLGLGDGESDQPAEDPTPAEQPPEEAPPEFDLPFGAETATEQELAEFADAMKNVPVTIDGEEINVRPPYHWNRDLDVYEQAKGPDGEPLVDDKGKPIMEQVFDEDGEPKKKPHPIKKAALDARRKNPAVKNLLREIFGGDNKDFGYGATVGKATPEQMKKFLDESLSRGLIKGLDKEGLTVDQKAQVMKDYLDEFGVSTDCSGLMIQALNFLEQGDLTRESKDSEAVKIHSTTGIADFPEIKKPIDIRAGDAQVLSGSHVRLVTDVDIEDDGVHFSTLESTTGLISKEMGSGVRELRWRFPDPQKRADLKIWKDGKWKTAGSKDQKYIYTRHKTLSEE